MMFDDDEDAADTPPTTERWDAFALVPIALQLVSEVHDAFGFALMALYNRSAMHANYRQDRRKFAASVGEQIEAMTK